MEESKEFVDLLAERRKDWDLAWVSRPMDPLLPHKLSPETRYTRSEMMKAVLANPRVRLAIESLAAAQQVDQKTIAKEAQAIINEMASKAHLPTVRWLGLIITKVLKRIFLNVYINEKFLFSLKKQMQVSQMQYVYTPSHRSYLDFILLSYILFSYDMALPNIASGMDFYRMRIVGELLRKTGAFYMRRSFSDDQLYKEIFRSYVISLVGHSDRAIEFFIEGTRSRSQKSIVPKYGLLSMILESLLQGDVPDIQFVPMSISYERPPEELLFVYELLGVPKPKESTTGLFRALSILQKPYGYGRVFFNIAEPISANKFLNSSHRRARVLSPDYKLPSNVLEDLAYSILESHKRNTILTPFNLIALLFNNRIQMNPEKPYTLDTLTEDYTWCKRFVCVFLKATVNPVFTNVTSENDVKEELLDSLRFHDELLEFDTSNVLRLKQRHKESIEKHKKFKGHSLSEETMRVAVSAINVAIYVNPIFAFVAQPAICAATIANEIEIEKAFEQYLLLRTLLSTEFALPVKVDNSRIRSEWEEILDLLAKENCLHMKNEVIFLGQNLKLFFLLHNVILPFVDAAFIVCTVLYEWDESVLGNVEDRKVLVEAQKRVEKLLFEGNDRCQHPYCLSLDLFTSTLSNLTTQGFLTSTEKRGTYKVNKVELSELLTKLQKLPLQRPVGSYLNVIPSLQAKL